MLHVPSAFSIAGVRVDVVPPADAPRAVLDLVGTGGAAVHLCNSYTLSLARGDADYRNLLNRAELNLADGTAVAWVGRRLGYRDLTGPCRGADLFASAVDIGRTSGTRHYLYGSRPEVVQALQATLTARFPGADIVGAESPPFRGLTTEEEAATTAAIRASSADIVWVGLGTPKQDVFVESFKARTGAVLVAVGAAFEFLGGTAREAPRWMHGTGTEWIYRLGSEPRRLFKRYLVGNSVFLFSVAKGEARRGGPPCA